MSDKLKADILSAFNGGELTPDLAGRVDKEELKFGTRYVSNFMPTHQGGLKKWYGTSKIASLPINTASGYKMVPFNGASCPLALLFCNGNVYAVSEGEVYQQSFYVNQDQLVDLSYLQINDIIYFTSPTSGIFKIQYYGMVNGHHKFILYNCNMKEEPFFPYSWDGNYNKTVQTDGYNGVVNVTATSSVSGYRLKLPFRIQNVGSEQNILFQSDPNKAINRGHYILKGNSVLYLDSRNSYTIGDTIISLIRIRGGIESTVFSSYIGVVKEIDELVSIVDLHLTPDNYHYDCAALKVVSESQIIQAFSSVNATAIEDGYLYFSSEPSGHQGGDYYEIRLEQDASAAVDPTYPEGNTVFGYTTYNNAPAYVVNGEQSELVVDTHSFDSTNIIGRKLRFHVPTDVVVDPWAQNITVEKNKVYYSDGNYYIARLDSATATTGTIQPIHRSGIRSDGAVNFEYFHSGYGIATVISVVDSTHMTLTVDGALPVLDISSETYDWDMYQWSMWGYNNRYPSKVFTYANRLGFTLDTDGYGSWLQMSCSDDYENFSTEEYGRQLDTSGINIMITGHSDNRINWVLSGYRLYMGSSVGEYNVEGDKSSGSFSPTNVRTLPVSNMGGANVDAVKYKDMNLFVGSSGEELYRLTYDYSSDDYVPDDLSAVSENLFADGISKMHILPVKERNLYFLTNNKLLRLCNMQEEIKTMGCYRVDLSGDVLEFTISTSGVNSLGFVFIKRDDVYTIEKINSDYPTYMLSTRTVVTNEEDPEIASTITDTELANKEIFVKNYETGAFYHTVVGVDGTFSNRFHTRALAYGLPLVSEVHTLPPYNQNNKLEGLQQKAVKFNIRLLDSGEFEYGSSNDFDKWYEYHNWNTQAGQEYNAPHKLMSGDLQLPAPFGYMQSNNKADGKYPNTTGVSLNIRSSSPEPFNLLMVSNLYV